MSREVRRVPKNWNHPRDENGSYIPMHDEFFYNSEEILQGLEEGWLVDEPPYYGLNVMAKGPWYQAYETVSEGTPISPPFETKGELIDWLSTNPDYWNRVWSREAAKDLLKHGFTLTGARYRGRVYRAEEMYLLKNKQRRT